MTVKAAPIPIAYAPSVSPIRGVRRVTEGAATIPHRPRIAEHCGQAARALQQWLDRYSEPIAYAGLNVRFIHAAIEDLERKSTDQAA